MKMVAVQVIGTNFPAFLQEVVCEEEVVIMKDNHPIAKLVPANTTGCEKFKQAVQDLIEFSEFNLSGGGLDWRELRDEGRKSFPLDIEGVKMNLISERDC